MTQVTPFSGGSNINLFDTNAVLDTSKKVIENIRELIKGCRGFLPYSSGKYKLVIETTGSASITLTEDDIIGGYNLSSPSKNERYNRVIDTFVNPDRNFQADEVQFPPVDDSGLSSSDQHNTIQTADANSVKMLGDATHTFVRSVTNGVSVEIKTFQSVGDTVIDYVGHNLSNTTLVPTYESYVVRDQQLNSSDVIFGTKLSSGINTTVETIPVTGTGMASESNIGITITSGSGSNAVLQPFVVDGKITKVVVETAGSGYNPDDIVLTVTNGGGSGAVLEPVLNGSGAFTGVTVTNEGIGYDSYRAFINKEVIEYTNHTTTNLKGVTRGIAGSTAATGAQNDKVYFDS